MKSFTTLICSLVLMALSPLSVAAERDASELYPRTCAVCHAAAVAGAPKTGDVAAWEAKMEATGSMEAMIALVNSGKNAMPPKGMCMDCSDAEFQALIEFMMQPQ